MDRATVTCVMLIGKTGTGKSSTGNTILCTHVFEEGKGARSMTESCRCVKMRIEGRLLSVIDTPGTMDVKDTEKAHKELQAAIEQCPRGIDAFLLTFRCDVRATKEEIDAAEQALDTYGSECYKRAIVVFTHGDTYENDEQEFGKELVKARREIPRLDVLLSKLDNRWVLLENNKDCPIETKERQIKKLFGKVDQVAKLNPRRYTRADQEEEMRRRQERALNEMNRQLEEALQEHRRVIQEALAEAERQLRARRQAETEMLKQQLETLAQQLSSLNTPAEQMIQEALSEALQQLRARRQAEVEMERQQLERLAQRISSLNSPAQRMIQEPLVEALQQLHARRRAENEAQRQQLEMLVQQLFGQIRRPSDNDSCTLL